MFGRRSDLPLERDISRRYLPWIIAVMVYLAALALTGVFVVDTALGRWDRGLRGTLTLQISPEDGADMAGRVADALEILRSTRGIERAQALSEEELAGLLEPWLGEGDLSAELPVPRLIDIRLRPGIDVDMAGLKTRIEEGVPGARLDDHAIWLDKVVRLTRLIQIIAAVVLVLIAGAAVATVIFATRAGLAVHHEIIVVLHLIGARDSYIARQFQAQALFQGLRGGFIGLGLAAVTLFLLARAAAALEGALISDFSLGPANWVALSALPLVAAALTTLTARATVMRSLSRML